MALSRNLGFEVCLKFESEFKCVYVCSTYIGIEWSGDLGLHSIKLERWQGMVRARAARSDKDGLLGVQGEEVHFSWCPSFTGFALDIGAIVGFVSEDEDGGLAFEEFSEDIKEDEKYFYSAENSFCGKKSL
ncbi:hypothetical protein Tco_0478925 [Tanacetum coccineum]